MAESRITRLAATISQSTGIYHNFLVKAGLPSPSHTTLPPPDTPFSSLPDAVAAALEAAREATHELHRLLLNPAEISWNAILGVWLFLPFVK